MQGVGPGHYGGVACCKAGSGGHCELQHTAGATTLPTLAPRPSTTLRHLHHLLQHSPPPPGRRHHAAPCNTVHARPWTCLARPTPPSRPSSWGYRGADEPAHPAAPPTPSPSLPPLPPALPRPAPCNIERHDHTPGPPDPTVTPRGRPRRPRRRRRRTTSLAAVS